MTPRLCLHPLQGVDVGFCQSNGIISVSIREICGTTPPPCSPPLLRYHLPMMLLYVSIRLLTIFRLSCLAAIILTEILLESVDVRYEVPVFVVPFRRHIIFHLSQSLYFLYRKGWDSPDSLIYARNTTTCFSCHEQAM